MMRGGPIAHISHDERGAIMVMFAVALPLILVFAAFVIDVANWWEHKRHLQMQADAAALAGGQAFAACATDDATANVDIRRWARRYAGIDGSQLIDGLPTYNAQIGGTSPEELHMAVNSRTWPLQTSPVDDTVVEAEPCQAGMVDVKLTETDVPWFFGIADVLGIDAPDYINAHARVSIRKIDQRQGGLPVGVPDSNPKQAKVQFINEDTGAVLGEADLTSAGTFNGYTKWEVPTESAVPVTVSSGLKNIGMRVILSGSKTNFECGQLLVTCYDTTTGLQHLRGWTNQAPGPVAKSIGMLSGTCSHGYFVYVAEGSCQVGMSADIDFGTTDPVSQGIKVFASRVKGKKQGNSYELSYNAGPSATLTTELAGDNDDLTYTADASGPDGNSIAISYVLGTELSVSVTGNDITVNIATDAVTGAATSTAAQVRDAVNAHVGASALVTAANATGNDGTGVVAAMTAQNLAGGSDGLWNLPAGQLIPIGAGAGAEPIELRWEQTAGTRGGTTCEMNKPCTGTFGTVQRPFSASDATSGPIRIVNIYDGGVQLPDHSLKQCNDGDDPALCTHSLTVELGLVSGFQEATSVDDPIVTLRLVGSGSRTQAVDCDPWVGELRYELIEGCRPDYAINQGTPCPGAGELWQTAQPWDCVLVKPGGSEGHVPDGMNGRILGDIKATTCTHPSRWRDYWTMAEDGTEIFTPDPTDPRIANVFMTPYGSFADEQGRANAVPITNFASFYITGWTGKPGTPNPCQDNGIDEFPDGATDPTWIYGRFIKYVETLSGASGSTPCDFADFGSCTAVLTE